MQQRNDPAERMPDDGQRISLDNVGQRGEIEHVFGEAVHRARRPRAVAVAAQVERVDVVIVTQRSRGPIPHARVIEAAVHQNQRGFSVGAPIPELQLEAIGIEEVRDGFQVLYVGTNALYNRSSWPAAH